MRVEEIMTPRVSVVEPERPSKRWPSGSSVTTSAPCQSSTPTGGFSA
jgi:hypothetical protein